MIDAGLPLVQCLDILGNQQEHKNFAKILLQVRAGRRGGRDARRRDAQAPEGLRRPLRQHGRGRRGGRYPRHDPAAARDLHREGRQAARAQVQAAHDLSDRRHRRSPAIVVAVILLEGHPDLRRPVRGPRRRAAAARRASSSRASNFLARYFIFIVVGDRRRRSSSSGGTTGPTAAGASSTACCSRSPIIGMILRKIAVARFCRTLATLTVLGRADPRRPRDHGQDRRQRHRRGRDHARRARASRTARPSPSR